MKVRILGIGDVVGKPGRMIIKQKLEEFCRTELVDLVIANGENLSGGSGLMPNEADELPRCDLQVDGIHSAHLTCAVVIDEAQAGGFQQRRHGRGTRVRHA